MRRSVSGREGGFDLRNPPHAVVVAVILVISLLFGFLFDLACGGIERLRYPRKYRDYVETYASRFSVPEAVLYAVMRTESGFDPNAESGAGACGIMQMMPSSFEWLQEKRGTVGEYTTDDLFNPEVCIDYGCYLLKYFYDYYGDERCAVAAYNAGFVVGEWLSDSNYSKDGKTLDKIPYPETSNYVDKVESAKEMYIKLYG